MLIFQKISPELHHQPAAQPFQGINRRIKLSQCHRRLAASLRQLPQQVMRLVSQGRHRLAVSHRQRLLHLLSSQRPLPQSQRRPAGHQVGLGLGHRQLVAGKDNGALLRQGQAAGIAALPLQQRSDLHVGQGHPNHVLLAGKELPGFGQRGQRFVITRQAGIGHRLVQNRLSHLKDGAQRLEEGARLLAFIQHRIKAAHLQQAVADKQVHQDRIPLPAIIQESLVYLIQQDQRLVIAPQDKVGDGQALLGAGMVHLLLPAGEQRQGSLAGSNRRLKLAQVAQHNSPVQLYAAQVWLPFCAQPVIQRSRLVKLRQSLAVFAHAAIYGGHVHGEFGQRQPGFGLGQHLARLLAHCQRFSCAAQRRHRPDFADLRLGLVEWSPQPAVEVGGFVIALDGALVFVVGNELGVGIGQQGQGALLFPAGVLRHGVDEAHHAQAGINAAAQVGVGRPLELQGNLLLAGPVILPNLRQQQTLPPGRVGQGQQRIDQLVRRQHLSIHRNR